MNKNAAAVQGHGYRLDGRVAVVTGAGGGIGAAIVDRLVELGASVALLDLAHAMPDLTRRAAAMTTHCIAGVCDIADETSIQEAASLVREQFGGCDILVNNAGILAPPSSIEDLSANNWERTLTVNLRGPFLCTRIFGAQILDKGKGSIVNIGSIAAASPNASPPYSVSKAGVLAFTRHTAVEWGPRGVRANSVSPGFIRTPLSENHYAGTDLLHVRISMVPTRRLGLNTDIANAVAYLASDAADFVNGQDLVVDGGFLQTTLMHAQPKADQYGGRAG
jgi:NAD(P)-dependent dehydrogenase (short-subunit alcohol dehydrogenase family)